MKAKWWTPDNFVMKIWSLKFPLQNTSIIFKEFIKRNVHYNTHITINLLFLMAFNSFELTHDNCCSSCSSYTKNKIANKILFVYKICTHILWKGTDGMMYVQYFVYSKWVKYLE